MKDEIAGKIESILKKQIISESEVSHLLSLVRKYLEHLSQIEQKQFSLLKFFCDWSQHIAIDRSIPALEILKKLNDTLVSLKDTRDQNELTNGITNVISFLSLKEQLQTFYTSIGIPNSFINERVGRENFLRNYIEIVLNCPLILPEEVNKKTKPYYDAIIANPMKEGMWVVGFAISRPDKTIFAGTKVANYAKFLSLVIFTSDTTRIVVPLTAEKTLGWKVVGQNVFPYISN